MRTIVKLVHLIAIVPFLGFLVGGLVLESRSSPMLLGLPFLLVWNLAWMVGCTLSLLYIYTHDRKQEAAK